MSRGDRVIRGGLVVSLTVVTGVAIVISYGHLLDLTRSKGESGASAATLPITVDGLVFAASLVILNAARHRSRPPVLAWIMLVAGIAATLAGNIAHGVEHGIAGAVIAGWPAVVAAGLFHLAIGEMRRGRESAQANCYDVVAVPEPDSPDTCRDFEPEPWPEDKPTGLDLWNGMPTVTAETGDPEPVPAIETTEPATSADLHSQPDTDPELEPVVATARDRFADVIATGGLPSVRAVRREMRVGYPRALEILSALETAAGK